MAAWILACGERARWGALLATAVVMALVGGVAGAADAQGSKVGKSKPNATLEHGERLRASSGPLQIVVSIADQHISVYGKGELLGRAPVSTGTASHPTPTGVFSVIQKKRHHRSNLYNNAPMPYMQRLTWSGIALHQGPLPGRPASHGCIRLPVQFARDLFRATRMGTRVIVSPNEITPVEIVHPALFSPRSSDVPVALRGTISDPLGSAEVTFSITDMSATAMLRDNYADGLFGTAIPATTMDAPEIPTINEPTHARSVHILAKEAERRNGPVSVFVSRKEGRLYVRQNFEPVFDVEVSIDEPHRPLGTHVFTVLDVNDDRVRWNVVSMPNKQPRTRQPSGKARPTQPGAPVTPSATAALERLHIPSHVRARINEMVTPGFSFTVSDHGLGTETGIGTDFIVVTR